MNESIPWRSRSGRSCASWRSGCSSPSRPPWRSCPSPWEYKHLKITQLESDFMIDVIKNSSWTQMFRVSLFCWLINSHNIQEKCLDLLLNWLHSFDSHCDPYLGTVVTSVLVLPISLNFLARKSLRTIWRSMPPRFLGPNSIGKFWLEFWLEIPYTKKMFKNE